VAPSVARDNAQAIVIAVDHSGFGDSRFAATPPQPEQASPRGLIKMLASWLDLLGLRDLPAVLVGHSMAAASLLTVSDDELGERISRVAITPVFPSVDKRYRSLLGMTARLLPTLGSVTMLRKIMGSFLARAARDYTRREQQLMAAQFANAIPTVAAQVARQYAASAPAAGDRLQRCMVLIAEHDPVAPAKIMEPALDALGFPRTHIRRLVTTGGHFPHAEQSMHPEWTLRNVADLTAAIGAMLRASSEGTPMATEVASTVGGS